MQRAGEECPEHQHVERALQQDHIEIGYMKRLYTSTTVKLLSSNVRFEALCQTSMPAIETPRTNLRDDEFAKRLDNRRAVKPAPKANRAKGPKLLTDAAPAKYRPGRDDSKDGDNMGVYSTDRMPS